MSLKLFHSLHLLLLFFICSVSSLLAFRDEDDQTGKTMEDFSGYPSNDSHSRGSNPTVSSLSANKETLQKQIDELSTFLDTLHHQKLGYCTLRRMYWPEDTSRT